MPTRNLLFIFDQYRRNNWDVFALRTNPQLTLKESKARSCGALVTLLYTVHRGTCLWRFFSCQVLYVTKLGHLVGEEWKIESRDYNNMLFKEQLLNYQSASGCLSLSNVCSIFQLSSSSLKKIEDFYFRNFLVILIIYYYIYFHA